MRVGVLQACTGVDQAAGVAAMTAAIEAARAGGADMLFTPEMSGILDKDRQRAAANIVEEADDPVLAAAREGAAKAGLWIHLGSLALKGGEGGRYVNRGFLIDDQGAIRARYDKIHLFDVDLPNGIRWRESESYAPGDRAVVAETPWGKIGLSICYDIRFPDLYRSLSDAGAVLLSVPAAFTVPTGEAHWHVLLRARAIEAGAFVIAAAQSGTHADGRETYGHSLVVDAWGRPLADLGGDVGVKLVDLDLGEVAAVREKVPAIRHRRPIAAAEVAA